MRASAKHGKNRSRTTEETRAAVGEASHGFVGQFLDKLDELGIAENKSLLTSPRRDLAVDDSCGSRQLDVVCLT